MKISTEFAMAWDRKYSSLAPLEPNTRVTVALGHSISAVRASIDHD